jgi:protein gp37
MRTTKIEWTDKTWNPVTGCTKISPGCANCYAEVMARRLQAMGLKKYANAFCLALHEDALDEPLKWRSPHAVFVCSMGDLFHEGIPDSFITKVMKVIESTQQHHYQLLTKRAERMAKYFQKRSVPPNAWLGVTVETQAAKERIGHLRGLDAKIRFLSCEPLLEDLQKLDLDGIHWVIVGGESGPRARPMKEEWVLSIQRQTEEQNADFFFKQWGTWGSDGIKRTKHANGKKLRGRIYQSRPMYA